MADEETGLIIRSVPRLQLVDVIRAGRWRTAFFTSYSLSLSYFEAVVLHALRHAGVRTASIAVDLEGYRSSLSEHGVSDAGRAYDVVPMSMSPGIFHPKLLVLEGESGIRATVGSGNLTFRGWGGNIEVVEYLNARTAPQAFDDLGDFLERVSSSAGAAGPLSCERDPVPSGLAARCRAAARIGRGEGTLRVLHSMERPIAEQIAEFARDLGGVSSFTVVSPFLNVEAIFDLVAAFGCEDLSVCVPAHSPEQFDFSAARAHLLAPRPVTADEFLETDRPLHAKILELKCRRGRMTLAGSVNATQAAMLSTKNVELAVLRVTDRPSLIGWRPCEEPVAIKAPPPHGEAAPCLVARFDGTRISGRILGVDQPNGIWTPTLGLENAGVPVEVDPDGRFDFKSDQFVELLRLGRAPQLVLTRGEISAAGWLVMDQLLAAIRERGRTAQSMARILAGAGDADDFAAILAFFAENPAALLSTSPSGSGHDKTKPMHTGASGAVNLDTLVPVDATITNVTDHSGSGDSAFELLLASFRRLMRIGVGEQPAVIGNSVVHGQHDDDPDAPPPSTVANKRAEIVMDALFSRLARGGVAHRETMRCILGYVRFVSGWVKEPDEFKEHGLRRWLTAAKITLAADSPSEPDDLDRMVTAVVTARVITRHMGPAAGHEIFQAWHGGVIEPSWAANAAPDGGGSLEHWLVAGADENAWSTSWHDILAAETHWTSIRKLMDALSAGVASADLPAFLTEQEAKTVRKSLLSPQSGLKRSVIPVDVARRVQSCPKCSIILPGSQNHRFHTERVAVTQCCDRVLLNLDLNSEHHSAT